MAGFFFFLLGFVVGGYIGCFFLTDGHVVIWEIAFISRYSSCCNYVFLYAFIQNGMGVERVLTQLDHKKSFMWLEWFVASQDVETIALKAS